MQKLLKILVQIVVGAGSLILVCAGIAQWTSAGADLAGIAGIVLLLSVIALLFVAFLKRKQK